MLSELAVAMSPLWRGADPLPVGDGVVQCGDRSSGAALVPQLRSADSFLTYVGSSPIRFAF